MKRSCFGLKKTKSNQGALKDLEGKEKSKRKESNKTSEAGNLILQKESRRGDEI